MEVHEISEDIFFPVPVDDWERFSEIAFRIFRLAEMDSYRYMMLFIREGRVGVRYLYECARTWL